MCLLIVFGIGPMAHSLAHCANVLDEQVVWLEDSPPPARDVLYFDSSFLNELSLIRLSKKKKQKKKKLENSMSTKIL